MFRQYDRTMKEILNKLEIIVDDETISVDSFMHYGEDPKFFAIKGPDLYIHRQDSYQLLKENFREEPKYERKDNKPYS